MPPNSTLSVIIRFHPTGKRDLLEEALFSLALQEWADLELVVVVQNGDAELLDFIHERIGRQPWRQSPRVILEAIPFPRGVDGRSELLNIGIARSSGRYLAFLDYDDLVYQQGYRVLIEALQASTAAFAIGACRVARYDPCCGKILHKEDFFSWGRTALDIFYENFVPIHSYVIDRSRLESFELQFNTALSRFEDYEFLLRLTAQFQPDMTCRDQPVCEYRICTDGSNTVLESNSAPAADQIAEWQQAREKILALRKSLTCTLSVEALGRWAGDRIAVERELKARDKQLAQLNEHVRSLQAYYDAAATALAEAQRTIQKFQASLVYRILQRTRRLFQGASRRAKWLGRLPTRIQHKLQGRLVASTRT